MWPSSEHCAHVLLLQQLLLHGRAGQGSSVLKQQQQQQQQEEVPACQCRHRLSRPWPGLQDYQYSLAAPAAAAAQPQTHPPCSLPQARLAALHRCSSSSLQDQQWQQQLRCS
jgi:hypothetical protein